MYENYSLTFAFIIIYTVNFSNNTSAENFHNYYINKLINLILHI